MAPKDVRKKLDPWSSTGGTGKVGSSLKDSWSDPWSGGTLPGRGPDGETPFGKRVSRPGTGKVADPWANDLYPPKDEFPQDGMTKKPGTGTVNEPQPYDDMPLHQVPDDMIGTTPRRWGNSNWNQFELWQPGQQVGGWDPNFKVDVPSGADENAIQAAHFLNWINQVMPMMSPADVSNVMQQLSMSLDALDNEKATEYYRKLAKNASTMGMNDTTANMWDRDRLRELRRATNAYFLGQEGGGLEDLDETERYAQDMINLLDMLVGVENPGSGVSTPGIWDDDNPMSRRERRQFWDKVNTYAGGVDENDPFGNILMTLLNPTTSTPMLNSYINMPDRSLYGGRGTQRAYGWQNPRYT